MNAQEFMAMALDPSRILQARGIEPDLWQKNLLLSQERQVLLNCCRQAGKSTTVSALALHTALFTPKSLTLLLSPSQRQSAEIFRKIQEAYRALDKPVPTTYETQLRLELANGSRVICLPGKEETIRSFGGVNLLIIDEASRVPDDLYRSVRPMLAVSQGRLICLSTPYGQRGWFFHEWEGEGPWKRVCVTWQDCPRITPAFIGEETRSMGQAWVDQEYMCLFTALEGLVYPDFQNAVIDLWPLPVGKPVGGIDYGWRNPFAAVWGVLDRDDCLWLGWERYLRETPLYEHAAALPRNVLWHADPAGRTETEELRAAGLKVRKGDNDIRMGIAAVTARIRTGRLKVLSTACPNLVAEAKLYRYPSQTERSILGENPIDEHNHALGALRYLVSKIDARFIAKLRKTVSPEGPIETETATTKAPRQDFGETQRSVYGARPWDDDRLWTPL